MVTMRVAFFGGTFDPIHRGHLRLASAAADAFALDRVLFAPVGNQPLKAKLPAASFADRLEMTRLALSSTTGNLQPATCSFLVSTGAGLARSDKLSRVVVNVAISSCGDGA